MFLLNSEKQHNVKQSLQVKNHVHRFILAYRISEKKS